MFQNTRLLIIVSVLILFTGFGFLWFGWNNTPQPAISTTKIVSSSSLPRVATNSGVVAVEGERVLVTKVVDGDTIVVNGKTTVRFVGMDTPETVDPRRPVGCYGKEASNKTKSLLTNKIVILAKDTSETDKFGRLLRLIYLPLDDGQTLFVNDFLVREGFAKVKTYPPDVKFESRFLEAEKQAKLNNRGLWGRCEKV